MSEAFIGDGQARARLVKKNEKQPFDQVQDFMFWETVVRSLMAIAWAIRRFKLGWTEQQIQEAKIQPQRNNLE